MKLKLYHISCLVNVLCCLLLITRLVYTQIAGTLQQNKIVIFGTFVLFAATFIKNIIGSGFRRYVDSNVIVTTKKMNLFYILRVAHMIVFLLLFAAQLQAFRSGLFSLQLSFINQIFFYSGTTFIISSSYTLILDRPIMRKLRRVQKTEKFSFEDEAEV